MRKLRCFAAVILAVLTLSQLCACRVSPPDPVELSSADEASAMGFAAGDCLSEMTVGEYAFFEVKIKIDYEYAVRWESSDPKVATVDSNGRVDAVAPGQVTISAKAMKAQIDYQVTVNKAKAQPLSDTTAITANESSLEQNKIGSNDRNLYALLVDTTACCVTAYTYNVNGIYNIPVRAMVCSVGKGTEGTYNIDSRDHWRYTYKYNYQYATKFGELYFCSAPYSADDSSALVADEYNKLGTVRKSGDVWLSCVDAKWIYDNCNDSTLVKVANDTKSPLGVPKPLILTDNSKSKTWDPTDSAEGNPYSKLKPYFEGASDMVLTVGGTFDAYDGVTAFDTCGNTVTGKFKVDGNVPCDKVGKYIVTYTYTDSLKRTGRADRVIKVVTEEEFTENQG